jgi:hypothetical protein
VTLFEVRTIVRVLFLAATLLAVAWQLWLAPYTGLADNGDFAKVIGRFSLGPAQPSEQDTFHFFIREWKRDPAKFWVSPYWGIEVWLARAALAFTRGGLFDIRWLGLLHTLIFSWGLWHLSALVTRRGWLLGLAAALAFADAAYVTYFQSFYFDAASIVFGFLFFASWLRDSIDPRRASQIAMFCGALGFSLSKGPHAPAMLLIAAIILATRRKAWIAAAIALVCGAGYMLTQTTREYQATAYYNLAFFKLGPRDPQALEALKIRPEDRKLLGTHAFEATSPAQNAEWLKDFFPEGGYANTLRYYASHPATALSVMWQDLRDEAKQIRAENLGNYERSTGERYCTLSHSYSLWSDAKSKLFFAFPAHVFFIAALGAWAAYRNALLRPIALSILGMGASEFGIATLADALETYRHLLLFHFAYDWCVVLFLCHRYHE